MSPPTSFVSLLVSIVCVIQRIGAVSYFVSFVENTKTLKSSCRTEKKICVFKMQINIMLIKKFKLWGSQTPPLLLPWLRYQPGQPLGKYSDHTPGG